MSYYGKSSKTDWSKHSNGLNKSSSQPYYYNPPELNTYKSTYLPLIKFNQQAEILSNKIDKSNRIKDQILNSRYKFLNNRGIDNNYRNKYKDSWSDFFKRKEREKQRRKIYKILKDESYDSSQEEDNANDIFRNKPYSMPSKIEDKIKLKQYLPAKKDLVKLMMKVNDNVNDRIDKNSYLLSKNIRNLENGYDDLKYMIENKINKLEKKQEEDFYDLRNYFKRRSNRENNKFDKHYRLENGNILPRYDDNNDENDYYKPNMKENIEQMQTYEIAKRIQNIPNLLNNMVDTIESIREYRQEEKNDFLKNFNNNIRGYYNPIYDDIDAEMNDNLGYGNYNKYYDNLYNFNKSYITNDTPRDTYLLRPSKPMTEIKIKNRKNFLSMSKSSIEKLKKNLKPLSYQIPKKKLIENKDDDLLTGKDLMEIYKERNTNKKLNYTKKGSHNSNNINIQENKTINKLRESENKNSKNSVKKDTQEKKKESDDDVVIVDSNEEKSKKSENSKSKKEETSKSESGTEENNSEENKVENNNEEKKVENINEGKKVENNNEEKKVENNNEVKKENNGDEEENKEDDNKDSDGSDNEGGEESDNDDDNDDDNEDDKDGN